jgi:hypothetical protein
MRRRLLSKGTVCAIRFYDHAIGADAELIECEAFGRVVSVTGKQVILEHWSIHSQDDETTADNRERVAISADSIIQIIHYAPKKVSKYY